MAAPINTNATNLEGQVFEVMQALQSLELAVPTETRPNQVTINPDFEALTVALAVTLPITFVTGNGGRMEVSAGTYL
ncbi:MAG: hypothetical protein EAZ76_07990 [Nostocales cyanobacterium]|nr:MAG: hypothetical protein EAZ87_21310 [Nostocales cyanobacterium]TAF16113.1 MAG: hypothetical protein EAZ76_07990 [Nostocales cyanobacterium]